MTNFRWPRVFAACILALMIATPAHAIRWLTWIDELSGPGPFDGYVLTGEVLCVGTLTDDDVQRLRSGGDGTLTHIRWCEPDRQNTAMALVVEFGRWSDKNRPGGRYEGLTQLTVGEVIAYFPLHRVFGKAVRPNPWSRSVELGAGLGFFAFSGSTVQENEWWRAAIPLRVRFMPSELFFSQSDSRSRAERLRRRLLQALQIRAGFDFIPGRMEFAGAFKGGGLKSKASNELNPTAAVQLDLGLVAAALFGKESRKK